LKPRFGTTFLFALVLFITFANLTFATFRVFVETVVGNVTAVVTTGFTLDVAFVTTGFTLDVAFVTTGFTLDVAVVTTGFTLDVAFLTTGFFTNLTVTVL
jgi:hypothetical protein